MTQETETDRSQARTTSVAAGLRTDDRAASMVDKGINLIVGVLVGSLLAAYLLPIAISELSNATGPNASSNWDSNVEQLFELLPLIIVLAVFLLFVAWAVSVYRSA